MKKIAIFVTSLRRGGAEKVTLQLAKYMVAHDVDCEVITLSEASPEEYEVPKNIVRTSVGSRSIRLLRRAIIASSADLLLIMDITACIFAVPACAGLPIKTVVSERNAPTHFSGKVSTKLLSRFLMRFADGFVFQTGEAKNFYRKRLGNKGQIIPNPVYTESLPEPYIGKNRDKTIVAVGRLDKQKNHELLINAFSKLCNDFADYNLIIYGEGFLRGHLESVVKSKGLGERILFPGNVINVIERIRKAMVFVMPSDYEGIPNALIEAMSVGLACISTDCPCGGPRSLITNDENGMLVPTGDGETLEKALRYLLDRPNRIFELGQKAIEIRERLNIDRVGRMWTEYLESVAESRVD